MSLRDTVLILAGLVLAGLFLSLPGSPSVFGLLGCSTCSSSDPYLSAARRRLLCHTDRAGPAVPELSGSAFRPRRPDLGGRPRGQPDLGQTAGLVSGLSLRSCVPRADLGGLAPYTITRCRRASLAAAPALVPDAVRTDRGGGPVRRLNITFLAYGFKLRTIAPTTLQAGDSVPTFAVQTQKGHSLSNTDGSLVINFVSPECPYCKEQLPILNRTAGSFRIVNVSPLVGPELEKLAPATEWVEDRGNKLRDAFRVSGSPTLFVIGSDGKISAVIAGVPDELEAKLRTRLGNQ